MAKFISLQEAVDLIPDGATIMVGGFLGCGAAHKVLEALSKSGKSGFTIIANDAAVHNGPDGSEFYGQAKLVHNNQVKKLIATHIGLNPEVQTQMNAGEMEVVLIPQGSLAEMIRAGGAGLGGVLTPTGVGTIVQDGEHVHQVVEFEGKKYLWEKPLKADVSIICGHKIDKAGNIWYKGTTRNFNQVMATAGGIVIAEADQVVEIGEIEPENVMTPGVYVDYVVDGGRA